MEKYGVCSICGESGCKKHSMLLNNVKRISEFSGSSPPEIFVGKWNYPNVYVGILSPQEHGNTEILSSQELWHKNKLSMPEIINLRSKLIYGRNQSNIKKVLNLENKSRFLSTMQEVAMTSKPIGTEFKLEKGIQQNQETESYTPLISKAAQVKSVRLEDNPQINKKIDYLVNDTDAKSTVSLLELEKSKIPTSTIIKILSAGLLGLGTRRKLVPTRWAITAVDDALSKNKLKRIKYYQDIQNIEVFTAEYLGNHYEFLILPDRFNFEVIEIKKTLDVPHTKECGFLDNPKSRGFMDINNTSQDFWHDYESFFGRKDYAESVTGAYYVNRLALCEYLEQIHRQCSCIVFREISPEYTQSMGVGILRQISREAFSKQPERFSTINEALASIQSRIKLPITTFTNKSIILKNYGKQKRITNFF